MLHAHVHVDGHRRACARSPDAGRALDSLDERRSTFKQSGSSERPAIIFWVSECAAASSSQFGVILHFSMRVRPQMLWSVFLLSVPHTVSHGALLKPSPRPSSWAPGFEAGITGPDNAYRYNQPTHHLAGGFEFTGCRAP